MARRRSDPATLGDLEDFADKLRDVFGPLLPSEDGDKGKRKGPKAPEPKDENDGDGDGDGDGEHETAPFLGNVSRGWFGQRAG